ILAGLAVQRRPVRGGPRSGLRQCGRPRGPGAGADLVRIPHAQSRACHARQHDRRIAAGRSRVLVRLPASAAGRMTSAVEAVSAIFGQVASAVVVALMLALSLALNFTQAYRSQRAAERLRQQVGQTTSILRDGAAREIAVRDAVPGDIVHLRAGDLVPADARLLSTHDLFVNEAALTGESLPNDKHA